MSFEWTDEQIAIREAASEFARRELRPGFAERDSARRFDREIWSKVADFGLLTTAVPTDYGGRGRPLDELILALEGIGHGCPDLGLALAIGAHLWGVVDPILRSGTEEQKRAYLPPLIDGRWIGAHNVTEWETGSDMTAITTTAAKSDDGWVVNGTKTHITNGAVADLHVVYCRLDDPGRKRHVCLIVPPGTSGINARSLTTLGTRTADLGEVTFTDCRVTAESVLGRAGAAALEFRASIERERALIFAPIVGAMRHQVEIAVERAKDRQAFGQPIGTYQAVSHRIADMAIRLETSRLLLYRLTTLNAGDVRAPTESSIAKTYISESFLQSSQDLIRTFGGSGYLEETGVEHFLRDAVASVLFSGTNDIQRTVIARRLGLG